MNEMHDDGLLVPGGAEGFSSLRMWPPVDGEHPSTCVASARREIFGKPFGFLWRAGALRPPVISAHAAQFKFLNPFVSAHISTVVLQQ